MQKAKRLEIRTRLCQGFQIRNHCHRNGEFVGTWSWDKESNKGGWGRYLANLPEGEPVPDYASPGLREDLSTLPSIISWVGLLEPFRDEVIEFIEKLKKASVPTKFRVFEGGFHGFEALDGTTKLGMEAMEFQAGFFLLSISTSALRPSKWRTTLLLIALKIEKPMLCCTK